MLFEPRSCGFWKQRQLAIQSCVFRAVTEQSPTRGLEERWAAAPQAWLQHVVAGIAGCYLTATSLLQLMMLWA